MAIALERGALQAKLTEKMVEVIGEPGFDWGTAFRSFMADDDGSPLVRVGVANCAPDMDIWEGLRSPAQAGMYPIELKDVWMHYAASNVKSTRFDGSPNPLAMPEPWEDAAQRLKRAVIISAMMPISDEVYESYAEKIERGDIDPFDYYCHARAEVGSLINKAVAKLAMSLMTDGRAVVPMTAKGAGTVITRTRSEYLKGKYHGPCNDQYPQNSIAVMSGLMHFGISRLPFRDEVAADGSVRRLQGQYASIIVFDETAPVEDAAGGVMLLDSERLSWLRRVNDFSDVDADVAAERYCTYNAVGADGETVCGKCIEACTSGALANSSPRPDGAFSESVAKQTHRFSGGTVKFDYGTCNRDRKQILELHDPALPI